MRQDRVAPQGLRGYLDDFVASREGTQAWIEPATALNKTSLLLVAGSGEWTRRAVPNTWAVEFARRHRILSQAGWCLPSECGIGTPGTGTPVTVPIPGAQGPWTTREWGLRKIPQPPFVIMSGRNHGRRPELIRRCQWLRMAPGLGRVPSSLPRMTSICTRAAPGSSATPTTLRAGTPPGKHR